MPRFTNSEVDAYVFIKETLDALGWNTKNPSRNAEGQVYTQGEALTHPDIRRAWNQDKAENVVKINETNFWVIEAKREHRQLDQAIAEARDYARRINDTSERIKATFISGVAGNRTDSYLIKTEYYDGRRFVPVKINGKEASSLLKPEEARDILAHQDPNLDDVIVDEKLFLQSAERINSILHEGAINKNQRARVMAALLLSLIDDTPPNIDATPRGLIRDINSRVANVLEEEGKPEFRHLIQIALPPSEDNHVKFKKALVQTIQELNLLNIRSAMNSGTDVLGKFYEVFLKYGNGAKEIGIVLTPRHITKFAVEAVGVSYRDLVFDPTCGTGGFLVAAFDHAKKYSTPAQMEKFKEHNLFGVEQEAEVVALAIVNMIFRGDGKNNITEGNCFQKNLVEHTIDRTPTAKFVTTEYVAGNQAITRVLMNPPFSQPNSEDKEYKFVRYALNQMTDGGILFSVLPLSTMFEAGEEKTWRDTDLLANNTLLAVVTFPPELFYPTASTHTLGVFIKKGTPHPRDQKVFWARVVQDGFVKLKGKRLPSPDEPDHFTAIMDNLKAFIQNPQFAVRSVPQLVKTAPIDYTDPLLELISEAYLDNKPISEREIKAQVAQLTRENAALLIRYGKNDTHR